MTALPINHIPLTQPKGKITGLERDQLLAEWQDAKLLLDAAKQNEIDLRNKIVFETDFFDESKEKGTERVHLGSGYQVVAVKKINWTTVDTLPTGETIEDALDLIEATAGKMAAEELIKFKPEVKISIYDKLSDEEKKIINPFLSCKPGTPSLELVEPVAK